MGNITESGFFALLVFLEAEVGIGKLSKEGGGTICFDSSRYLAHSGSSGVAGMLANCFLLMWNISTEVHLLAMTWSIGREEN